MPAMLCVALPLPATPKVVTKWAFIYVKRAKAKNSVISYPGFPEYRMANASNFMRGFTPANNPKRGNKWLLFMLKGSRLKTVSYRILGFSEYEMTNPINLKCAFTPASNPKRGAKQYHVCHRSDESPANV